LDIVHRLRQACPGIALTSDFIVGFPNETEDDFAATLSLVSEIGFSGAFSFKYSPRPGTPGAEMTGQIDEAIKSERLARLQQAIDRSQAAFNHACLGRTFDVLFERPGRHPGQLVGRSPYLQPVQAVAPATLIGRIAAVTITEIGSNSLFGMLAEQAPRAAISQPTDATAVATGA
jgi:tRNA-2-methylthio-N6-dimethylallyladenosine synthase